MPRSARIRTSEPATSPRTSRMRRGSRRARRGSEATSGPASTIRSVLRSRLGTMLGLHPARSSPMMSRPDRWPVSLHAKRQRKAGSTRSMESVTAELALPGLEKGTMSEPSQGHWIERGPQKGLMVFSARSHPDLARSIAAQLGLELGEIELETFTNDETYCRYTESIRGADVFLVQTGSTPVDKHLMELMLMIQAAKLASAKRITAVVPLFP